MELKQAQTSLTAKPKKIKIEDIEKALKKERFFYLARENEHKDLIALQEHFEEQGFNVYIKEVKYGLGELDYIYEAHIL
jgi:hypothetical protein